MTAELDLTNPVVAVTGVAGGWVEFGRQAILALIGLGWPFVITLIVLWVTPKFVGLRVNRRRTGNRTGSGRARRNRLPVASGHDLGHNSGSRSVACD